MELVWYTPLFANFGSFDFWAQFCLYMEQSSSLNRFVFFGARNYAHTYSDNYPIWSEIVNFFLWFSDHYECFRLRVWLCHLPHLFFPYGDTENVWHLNIVTPGGLVHHVLELYEFFQVLCWTDLLGKTCWGDTGV